LKSKEWTIPGGKRDENTGLNELLDGNTIDLTTKNKKTIKVKFEKEMLKQAF
jgi:hypothetical protein